ncbi:copper chaperone PCu(A)C [Streptomyces sp. J2-1]|uniref:copper chaperone PCu(A)C n=1 Tax=Streptomyces corallincola TaxID=2851888 RepID=UPI001C38381C|nr:copper chaperone PCu(A)C [Streptomyces corallincola]MBV2354775.1 copper chaperone PCu(A)C [Streptomyces corallincola]
MSRASVRRVPARRALPAAGALLGALALAGCSGSAAPAKAELSVSSSYMPRPVAADMAAGFLTITNRGGTADRLTSVRSDAAGDVTMHSTTGGMMREQTSFAIPAHGRLVFRSGGNHLMFEGLKHRPAEGQDVKLTLTFARSAPLTVEMPVKSATYNPATGH